MKTASSVIISLLFPTIFCAVPALAIGAEQANLIPHHLLVQEQEAERVTVPFVTLRNKTGEIGPAHHFGGERGELEAGFCTVAFFPIRGLETIAESVPFYIPDEKITLERIDEASVTELQRTIKESTGADNGNLVLYIHGYNIDFDKSCRHTALLQRAIGIGERLLLFSWPADGNMLTYTWDESDLVWSVPQLAQFLEQTAANTGNGTVDVVAHSLGARGVVQALVRLSYRNGDQHLLNELVLIAPDVDTGVFRQDVTQLKKIVSHITVYASANDKALQLSQEVHGYARLGQAGDHLALFAEVDTIDISGINNRRFSGHIYHLFNPEVIYDLTELLKTGKPAAHRSHLEPASKDGLHYWLLQAGDE